MMMYSTLLQGSVIHDSISFRSFTRVYSFCCFCVFLAFHSSVIAMFDVYV